MPRKTMATMENPVSVCQYTLTVPDEPCPRYLTIIGVKALCMVVAIGYTDKYEQGWDNHQDDDSREKALGCHGRREDLLRLGHDGNNLGYEWKIVHSLHAQDNERDRAERWWCDVIHQVIVGQCRGEWIEVGAG